MFNIPIIPDMPDIDDRMIDHYKLDDGRIWSVSEAKFVTTVPDNAKVGPCPDEQGNNSLEGLIGCLEFYGYAMGELADGGNE